MCLEKFTFFSVKIARLEWKKGRIRNIGSPGHLEEISCHLKDRLLVQDALDNPQASFLFALLLLLLLLKHFLFLPSGWRHIGMTLQTLWHKLEPLSKVFPLRQVTASGQFRVSSDSDFIRLTWTALLTHHCHLVWETADFVDPTIFHVRLIALTVLAIFTRNNE